MRHPHFDPTEHPRGPNGRFTESFAVALSAGEKKHAGQVTAKFHPRKDLTTPEAATGYLQTLAGDKPDPSVGGFLAGGFKDVNGGLRAGNADLPGVSALDKAMKPIPDDVTAWRHIPAGKFGNVDPQSLVGMKVHDAGFFPTVLAPPKRGDGVRLQVDIPAGTKAAPAPDQFGLVLDRGLDMAVTHVAESADGGLDMTVTVLPDGTKPDVPKAPPPQQGPQAEPEPPPEPPAEPGPATPPATPPATSPATEPGPSFADRLDAAVGGEEALNEAPISTYTERGWEEAGFDLDDEHMEAVERYQANHDWEINNFLRTGEGDTGRVQGWVDNIDEVMERSRLRSEVAMWRGLRDGSLLFGDRLDGDLTGMEWNEAAYLSTTADEDLATSFANGSAVRDRAAPNPVLMHLIVPAGVGGVELSDGRYEAEMLLQRGLTLRIVADHGVDPSGVRRIDVVVVPVGS